MLVFTVNKSKVGDLHENLFSLSGNDNVRITWFLLVNLPKEKINELKSFKQTSIITSKGLYGSWMLSIHT